MEPHDVRAALVPVPGQETLVRRRFADKVRSVAGRVPFLDRAVAAYLAAVDRRTPASARAVLFAALAYFVIPTDMIPDFIAALGYTDDATVLMVALRALSPHIRPDHHRRAKQFLDRSDETERADAQG